MIAMPELGEEALGRAGYGDHDGGDRKKECSGLPSVVRWVAVDLAGGVDV